MKLRILLSSLAALTVALCCHSFTPLPPQLDGSMMPYDFAACRPAGVPDSLQAFHIGYVARHGARFLSSAKKVGRVASALAEARAAGTLTPLGRDMECLLDTVRHVTAARWGALDSVGIAEQDSLAAQLSAMWPSVTARGRVQAEATYVPRVVMSMYTFCHRLAALNPDLDIYTAEGHMLDPLLRYFTTNPLYVSYLHDKPWQPLYDDFVRRHVPTRPARALVGPNGSDDEMRTLTLDIYGVLQSLRAAGLPAPTDRWMSAGEYRACWQAADMAHYYARSISPLSAEPAAAAIPLLQAVVDDADAAVHALAQGDTSEPLHLWFGHAETLMPLLALMDMEGCTAPDARPGEVAAKWRDYGIVPLGANFELVLLRAPSGTVWALTRLNGRDTPLRGQPSALLPWKSLRALWLQHAATMRRHALECV